MKTQLFLFAAALAFGQQPAPKIRVTGSVIALNGEPVRKATVRLQGQPPITYTVSTGDDGKFAFDDVAPGRYTLLAEKAGFVTQRFGARTSTAPATPLVLTAGQELNNLSIQMTPQSIITGRVTDQDGDPVPMSIVYLQRYVYTGGRRQLSSSAANQTNDQGDFRIANLAPGRYYAYARDNRPVTTSQSRAAAQEVSVQTYYPSATEPAGATPLDVTPGGELRGINIQMRRGRVYSIRGKLLDPATGGLAGGVQLELDSKNAANRTSMLSGSRPADGGFEFRNLPAGTYTLRAVPREVRGADGKTSMLNFTGRIEVTVSDASVDGVVMPLVRGFEIEGTVKLEDGDLKKLVTPPPAPAGTAVGTVTPVGSVLSELVARQAAIAASAGGGAPGRLTIQLLESFGGTTISMAPQIVKEDGTFLFQGLGASTYLVAVAGLPDGTYVKSIRFGGKDVAGSPMELSGGGQLAIVLSSKAGAVSGTVRNDKRDPMGGYLVSVWPRSPDLGSPGGGVKTATTDQNGSFSLRSLAPGEYFVAAWDDLESGLAQSAEFLAHFNSNASAIKVEESGQVSVDPRLIGRDRTAAEIEKLP